MPRVGSHGPKDVEPASLRVEHPPKFEPVGSLETARASGLTIRISPLPRADQVIDQ